MFHRNTAKNGDQTTETWKNKYIGHQKKAREIITTKNRVNKYSLVLQLMEYFNNGYVIK